MILKSLDLQKTEREVMKQPAYIVFYTRRQDLTLLEENVLASCATVAQASLFEQSSQAV